MESIAISVPAVVLAIVGMGVWWVRRTIERADRERVNKDKAVQDSIGELQKSVVDLKIQLEKRVTYEHFEKEMKEFKDEIRSMLRDFKEDVKTLVAGTRNG